MIEELRRRLSDGHRCVEPLAADVTFGVSWNWNEFDRETHAANTALGSEVADQIDAGYEHVIARVGILTQFGYTV